MTTKAQFLNQLEIFAELVDDELAALARIADEYTFEEGSIIAYQRDIADKLIIVRTGRLYAEEVDKRGIVRDSRQYLPGSYFEDVWLFTPSTHRATVRGTGDGRVIFIDKDKFTRYLDDYPYILDYLNLSDEALDAAEASTISQPDRRVRNLGLLPDEIIMFNERRSIWSLLISLIGPMILLLIWLLLLAIQSFVTGTLLTIVAVVPVVLALLFMVGRTIDWSNDYFIITNKQLIHREYDLVHFRASVTKTPIDQVQSVEIEKPGLLATLLNVGTARVTTAAQSGVTLFDFIDDPIEVKTIINELREQVKDLDAGRVQEMMRSSLEEHFEVAPNIQPVEEPAEEEEEEEEVEERTPFFLMGGLWGRLRRGVGARVEEQGVITYRKHFFTLFGRLWQPLLVGAILFAGLMLVPWVWVATILSILLLIDLGWLVWRFEDWRNDTFQLTDRYVVDIDRRPFGFGESRKQAELGNVQNVNADRPGFFATLFNYGFVYIETAGASADITFEKVVNPNLIQSDIFRRREEFRQHQRIRESAQRRQEYAVLVDVYRQAQEQQRLPRRTPPDLEI